MKKTSLTIFYCLTASVTATTMLFLISNNLTRTFNAFLRIFPPHPITATDTINVRYNSYYIAGATPTTIYLGNLMAPLNLLVIDCDSGDTTQQKIKVHDAERIRFWSLNLKVDSPYFYLSDGTLPAIFNGTVDNWRAIRSAEFDNAFFTDALPLSEASLAIRSLSSSTNQYALGKETTNGESTVVTFNHDLLKKQVDGKFCVDGSLQLNRELNKLVYTYYYRNQFLVMDTSMALLYEGKTIDTISRAQVEVSQVAGGRKETLSAPPLMVNKRSCTSGNWLLVNSNLMAKNETAEDFENASVIDVYDINNGEYQFSFYIDNLSSERLRYFYLTGNKLFALFERHLVVFDIIPKYQMMKDNLYLSQSG